jgi:hypothetical protein
MIHYWFRSGRPSPYLLRLITLLHPKCDYYNFLQETTFVIWIFIAICVIAQFLTIYVVTRDVIFTRIRLSVPTINGARAAAKYNSNY